MVPTANVETVCLNSSNTHAEYTVTIDNIVVNVLVTSDFRYLDQWFQQNLPRLPEDDDTSAKGDGKKQQPLEKRVLGMKLKCTPDIESDESDDDEEFDSEDDEFDDEVKEEDTVQDGALVEDSAQGEDSVQDEAMVEVAAKDPVQDEAMVEVAAKDPVQDAAMVEVAAEDPVQDEAMVEVAIEDPVQEDDTVQNEDDAQVRVRDKTLPSVIAFCYGTECIIYQFLAGQSTSERKSLSLPFRLFSTFYCKENVFVGRGIVKEVEKLQPDFYFNMERMKVVDVRSCHAHPSFNRPDMPKATLRSLARKVLKKDIVPRDLGGRPWEVATLSNLQVENLAVSTFISAKIGTSFGL